jgi:hypothetical protein
MAAIDKYLNEDKKAEFLQLDNSSLNEIRDAYYKASDGLYALIEALQNAKKTIKSKTPINRHPVSGELSIVQKAFGEFRKSDIGKWL